MLRQCCLIIFTILLLSLTVHADEKVVVGVHIAPPVMEKDSSGKYFGSMINILEKVIQRADIEHIIKEYPTKRLYKNLGKGNVHLFVGIKNVSEYHENVFYSGKIVDRLVVSILRKSGTTPIRHIRDLVGKEIIINSGYSYAGLRDFVLDEKNNVIVNANNSNVSMLKMLEMDRAQYCIFYSRIARQALKEYPLEDIVDDTLNSLDFYIILSKKAPHRDKLLKAINEVAEEENRVIFEIRNNKSQKN